MNGIIHAHHHNAEQAIGKNPSSAIVNLLHVNYETYNVMKNGVIIEWPLSNHAMAFNLGFVPFHGKTNCLFGLVGYTIKASYLKTRNELQRTTNHDNYWGVRIEGTAFHITTYLAAYTNFNNDFDSFVVFGMGVRF
ncbi:hypothetical protein L0337_12620 [candidate division KSB1 bacterium]|nr:hypothetical protein [candidate division KSB1 bacterium]